MADAAAGQATYCSAVSDPIADLRAAVDGAAAELREGGATSAPTLERPPKPEFGDYSTNAAMLLAPTLGEQPRTVAERLGEALGGRLGTRLDRAEVAGPGFLNLFLADAWYRESLAAAIADGEAYGGGVAPVVEKILIEFVSANPTGPITVASGRHAAYGDSLCRLLAFAGHEVTREYYVNDHGTQVRLFGESIKARARGEDVPEGGYEGDYVAKLAAEIDGAADADEDELVTRAVELMMDQVRATLGRFRVGFDEFFSERSLHEAGAIDEAIGVLEEREKVYPSEGAVWMRTTEFGDDKDRVLMRASGELTYFAADIAHHRAKLDRRLDRAIDVFGADHHGYVARVRAAWEALGGDAERFEVLIMQLVKLIGVASSKRKGEFVTLDELLDDIGVDAARFFLLQRSHDTMLDLDLELARKQSQDNPVYYVQYAHARIASILRKAGEERVERALAADLAQAPPGEQLHPSARALLLMLLEFPSEVAAAAERRGPHRMTTYGQELAQAFSAFYRDCQVVGGEDEDFRIAICVATRRVLARSLDLLGVEAPESM